MKNFENINDILDFAINEEQKAVDLYTMLAQNASNQEVKEVFMDFAKEEIIHKKRLMDIKENGLFDLKPEMVTDLKISDYMMSVDASPDMTYAESLVFAMKKEKAAFKLYSKLAERAPNENLKNIFLSLAVEESKHKLRFEIEYDEYVLREN
ncbi:MAG: ferritin family protein [Bacteroidetes bacterium]|nr:ferritin family protein [Bacteroidota bacterium]